MPSPTISNFFGDGAQVLTSTTSVVASAADPVLVVKYSDFVAQGWNALASGDELDPEKWTTGIVLKIKDFSASNGDDLPNLVVNDPFVGLETRATTLKRRFTYSLDIYQPDSGTSAPDPDLI